MTNTIKILVLLLLMTSIFVFDLFIPLGVAVGVLYIFVVFYSLSFNTRNYVLFFAALSSILILTAFVIKPYSGEHWKIYANRFLSLLSIWVCSYLGFQIKKQELKNHNLAQELVKQNQKLVEYDYTVAHDLKTPLSAIKFNLSMIKNKIPNMSSIKDELAAISKGVENLSEMITAILSNATQEESFKSKTSLIQEVDLNILIQDIISQLNLNKKVIYETHFEITKIWCHKISVQQIFLNIISNAIKYSHPSRTCEIKILIKRSNKFITMEIQDNGIGIEEENLQLIFHKNSRTDRGAQIADGYGIGLYTVEKLIKELNGKISVSSQIGIGSCFKLSFNENSLLPIENKQILLFDDDPDLHHMADFLLKDNCIQISHAYNTEQFESLVSSKKFDALLMDLNINEVSSNNLIAHYSTKYKTIIISAHLGNLQLGHLTAQGVYSFIEKPLTREKLIAAIWF